jgi:hypothetical protein
LSGWPNWFLERPKLGFALNLRWLWAFSNFSSLRESIDADTIAFFGEKVPVSLRRSPSDWKRTDILRNFQAAWRLLVWARFAARVADAARPVTP